MTSRSEIDKHDKPVAWRSMEGSQYSLHHWAVDPYPESGPRIYRAAMAAARPPREPLYPASVVASLTAQRDAALARVAELEKDAARWRFSMWYQQEHLKNPSLRCEAIDELYRSRVELSADNYTAAIDKAITSTPDYDAALTKGQP